METYLIKVESLDVIASNLGLSHTTCYRRLLREARECPDWRKLLERRKKPENRGIVLGIDTTELKIGKFAYVYLHVAEVISRDPLAYEVCKKEDATTIEAVLLELRNQGYDPEFAVCDLAPEILNALRHVFPMVKIQGCLFHLAQWLDKELPTINKIKDVEKKKVELWTKVKDSVKGAAISKDEVTRQQYLEQLRRMDLDEISKSVVWRFFCNLKYYHTIDQLKDYGESILYNNVCECHIGMIKDLRLKMRGFKSFDADRDFINSYWFFKRKCRMPFIEQKEYAPSYDMPLSLFNDFVSLTELSNAMGIPREMLNRIAQKMGLEIIGDYAFTERKLKDIQKCISKLKKISLIKIMDKIGFDQWTVVQLLKKFGFKTTIKSLDLSDATISAAGHE